MTATTTIRAREERATSRRRWRLDPVATASAVVLALFVLAPILAPWIAPYPGDGTTEVHPENLLQAPSAAHLMGTDTFGRDVLSRLIYGARTSLFIVAAVLLIAVLFGTFIGLVAGYFGGWVRDVLMRITDIFLAFPALLLSVALAMVLKPSVSTVIIAIAVTWWPWYARLAVGMAASIRSRAYVDASRTLGQSHLKVILKQVLPNATTPVIVQTSLDAGGVILTAAALSYLGLGVKDPTSEWGLMVQQGQSLVATQWWVMVFPGLAILVTAFCFNMLGEGLRSALDVKKVAR